MNKPQFYRLDEKHPIILVETWNAPYSTGAYFLSADGISKEEVAKYAEEHVDVHFPFWPLVYMGKLWSKDTWDD